MYRVAASIALSAVLAAACGTGGADLAVEEPTPSLFDDAEVIVVESTTTRPPAVGVEQLAGADLPAPRTPVAGAVVVDGIALAVDEVTATGWFAASPCGAVVSGESEPVTALVAIDPAGDARVESHGAVVPELNHTIATILASELEAVGVSTIVTRAGDDDVVASVRSAAADASGARVVVSIAIADGGGTLVDAPPLEVVHPAADADGRRLAGLIHQSLVPVLLDLPGAWTASVDPGVRSVLNQRGSDFFTMLREGDDQARVVVHLPALTGDTVDLFRSPVTTVNMGQALADAIARHLLTDEEGDGFVTPGDVVRHAPTASGDACVEPLAVGDTGDGAG
ncbi:MAG: hypothetical protein AAF081_11720 [Actinomycetota bacterium]